MSVEHPKPISSITVTDLRANPVWQFTNRDEPDETFVRAVKRLPVDSLTGRVVGTEVRLANGHHAWALLGNINTSSVRLTEHFLTLSVERYGKWFALARYHDFDHAERGPGALASFLSLPIADVFPISFDIRPYAAGDPGALCGIVRREPREHLSRAELIAMAVP